MANIDNGGGYMKDGVYHSELGRDPFADKFSLTDCNEGELVCQELLRLQSGPSVSREEAFRLASRIEASVVNTLGNDPSNIHQIYVPAQYLPHLKDKPFRTGDPLSDVLYTLRVHGGEEDFELEPGRPSKKDKRDRLNKEHKLLGGEQRMNWDPPLFQDTQYFLDRAYEFQASRLETVGGPKKPRRSKNKK